MDRFVPWISDTHGESDDDETHEDPELVPDPSLPPPSPFAFRQLQRYQLPPYLQAVVNAFEACQTRSTVAVRRCGAGMRPGKKVLAWQGGVACIGSRLCACAS